jgi:hypothetical protein
LERLREERRLHHLQVRGENHVPKCPSAGVVH